MFESLKTPCTPFLPVMQKPLAAIVQADAAFSPCNVFLLS